MDEKRRREQDLTPSPGKFSRNRIAAAVSARKGKKSGEVVVKPEQSVNDVRIRRYLRKASRELFANKNQSSPFTASNFYRFLYLSHFVASRHKTNHVQDPFPPTDRRSGMADGEKDSLSGKRIWVCITSTTHSLGGMSHMLLSFVSLHGWPTCITLPQDFLGQSTKSVTLGRQWSLPATTGLSLLGMGLAQNKTRTNNSSRSQPKDPPMELWVTSSPLDPGADRFCLLSKSRSSVFPEFSELSP